MKRSINDDRWREKHFIVVVVLIEAVVFFKFFFAIDSGLFSITFFSLCFSSMAIDDKDEDDNLDLDIFFILSLSPSLSLFHLKLRKKINKIK